MIGKNRRLLVSSYILDFFQFFEKQLPALKDPVSYYHLSKRILSFPSFFERGEVFLRWNWLNIFISFFLEGMFPLLSFKKKELNFFEFCWIAFLFPLLSALMKSGIRIISCNRNFPVHRFSYALVHISLGILIFLMDRLSLPTTSSEFTQTRMRADSEISLAGNGAIENVG